MITNWFEIVERFKMIWYSKLRIPLLWRVWMSNTKFQELNLSDSFLFPAALEDPITCRLILECIVEENISELFVRAEYTKQFNSWCWKFEAWCRIKRFKTFVCYFYLQFWSFWTGTISVYFFYAMWGARYSFKWWSEEDFLKYKGRE